MRARAESPIFGVFDVVKFKKRKRNAEEEHRDINRLPFVLNCEFLKEEHLKPDQKIVNKVFIQLNGLLLSYQHENVMRIRTYFFDQFLDAITGEKVEKEVQNKWYSTCRGDDYIDYSECDLGQDDKYTLIEILINQPKILLKDRPHLKESFVFKIEKIKLINSIELSKGRWHNFADKV